jgi:hypothetical protein
VFLHTSSTAAEAEVVARAGGKFAARQRISLTKRNGHWAVSAPLIDPVVGTIQGPTDAREPTPRELEPISAVAFLVLKGASDCVRFVVSISRVNPDYAAAALRFFGPQKAQCEANGSMLFRRAGGKWRYLGAGSDPFRCTVAPPGVIRSLFGTCFIEAKR